MKDGSDRAPEYRLDPEASAEYAGAMITALTVRLREVAQSGQPLSLRERLNWFDLIGVMDPTGLPKAAETLGVLSDSLLSDSKPRSLLELAQLSAEAIAQSNQT